MAMEQLTEREQQALEHLRKASELEVSLAEYCRSFELDVKDLYSAKQSIAKKGQLPARVIEQDTLADDRNGRRCALEKTCQHSKS